ncbi:bifunctional 6-phosphofructo-2-kinase/fructose-2,6-bisphosphate 2-phosphatase [Metschnikowia bicuspidata var. bicuspidata NRRL YB-4993]|uniref:Bifunctional 6-phosphofructo-2-kinase/fructose-2,6-bisphosphate 2-phosphatase n=1 Tax=Metschnikowia bicuspidata var. bicuspidata NRRL YB-4993 TaxID=869754 RepID=A0A1A0H8Y6_9ASCO|nr:bifunctional 6-phosphofructo-2-kinase/fructose-2,6-bisphosphate 2-phosphatase [Metschnikowia bicuspidata var. bicuspidata NRRL YB-4993]OBA20347.1 bifunctional 6-phosphofructo-2-kinase/fructose-2,6-bisphosphate 2-phosphatase [Metschnikowia bicuspidata var. bicuspidata NRRL YB-4993]
MSAVESDAESERDVVAVSEHLLRHVLLGRRTKKRWSFHDSSRPNLVGRPAAANRRRRLSDVTGIDGVHKEIDPYHISPAQLYLTESGRLFHAGKICIALAGLPGRGKTHLLVLLTRYLRWLGVKTHSFHLCDYRRALSRDEDLDHMLFVAPAGDTGAARFENQTVDDCLNDILNFFENDKGQVAIYDAVNARPEYRRQLADRFKADGIQCIFIELTVTDASILHKNIDSAARLLPDYENWDYAAAHADYSRRIHLLEPYYREMSATGADAALSFIKFINFGRRIELNNSNYGYLINKVVFFLMNSRIKLGSVYFARCYKNDWDYLKDPPLDAAGVQYSRNLAGTVLKLLEAKGRTFGDGSRAAAAPLLSAMKPALSTDQKHPPTGADGVDDDSFVVWTSVKKRTIQTTQPFRDAGVNVRHRIQLSQRNPGVVAGMSDDEIQQKFPSEYALYLKDSYHHRFSRAELYHDLAIKIEPLILEMERMSGDILIIADETVLRVLHGYLMAFSCYDIPWLEFSMDDIIEVKFNAYANTARRIPIEDFSAR